MSQADVEAQVRACYSTWSGRYYDEYYGPEAVYPPVHRALIRGVLQEHHPLTVLDAGCGPASFLRGITDLDADLYGFDLTPQMIAEARRVLEPHGVPSRRLWEGSVLDPSAFDCPGEPQKGFGAVVCGGVLPHIPVAADEVVIGNLHDAVAPGGVVVIEARNQLFGLFTMNRYSHELFRDRLVDAEALRAQARPEERAGLEQALDGLEAMFRTDLPPVRAGYEDEPGYDEVLSRTHNPLVLAETMRSAGFVGVRTLYYHYHPLPPMLEAHAPDLFRRAALAMEDPEDWRGLVMASAFLLVGIRP